MDYSFLGYEPSEYQKEIFDYIREGYGNIVINACAGSGKTKTIISCTKLIPERDKCLFIAFNKSIVDELSQRIGVNKNIHVKTLHSLGYTIIKRNFRNLNIEIDEYKYINYLKQVDSIDLTEVISNIKNAIDFCRFNLCQSEKDISDICVQYGINLSKDECNIVYDALQWGKENIITVDFTDLIWLPNELSLSNKGLSYDWVFLDECQDASKAAINLFLKTFKRGCRFIAVGDENQMIYAFAGASPQAMDFIKNYKNTTLFNLPITYRCAKSIVKLSTKFSDNIIPHKNALNGTILYDQKISTIKDGDMVLSRAKKHLFKVYINLLKKGIACYIKGNEIGLSLEEIINKTKQKSLHINLDNKGVFSELYMQLFRERDKLIKTKNLTNEEALSSELIQNIYDNIVSLELLASNNIKTSEELISKLKEVFSEKKYGVILSTIHKSKGLESDRVHILCHSTLAQDKPSYKEWEKIQEKNLAYVAYTRAKNYLGFISENEIGVNVSDIDSTKLLMKIELKLKVLYNTTFVTDAINVQNARERITNYTEIKVNIPPIIPVQLNNKTKHKRVDILDLFKQ